MNKVFLIGRLVKEADLRYTKNGKAVAVFTIAVNRNKEQADFIRITAFNRTAENVANYLQKGSLVAVDGTIVTGSYEKDGQRIYTTDIWANTVAFLDTKGKGTGEPKNANTEQNGAFGRAAEWDDDPFAREGEPIVISDDDLPF
jgi:single-strand DNA-binding protein